MDGGEVIAEGCVQSLPGPRHVPGPLNGNPYALVDRKQFCNNKHTDHHPTINMQKVSDNNYKSFQVSKGISDLDNLLSELGYLSSSCKKNAAAAETMETDENSNFALRGPSDDDSAKVTTRLPTINVVCTESPKSIASNAFPDPGLDHRESNDKVVTEIRVKPRLPARTSSFGAVHRHQKGSLGRSLSEDANSAVRSANVSRKKNDRNESTGSDDVFNLEGPFSPTVSDMLFDLANSPLSEEGPQYNWQAKKMHNFSGRYDNFNEGPKSESGYDNNETGEFTQGRVRDHVKQFNQILTSPDPSKVGTGVPMPGLVQGIDCEDEISKFNYRSLAPGQRGPTLDHIYIAGSPPKKIVHDTGSEVHTSPVPDADDLFIPSYADRPAEYYLSQREKSKQEQGMKLNNNEAARGRAHGNISQDATAYNHAMNHSSEAGYHKHDHMMDDAQRRRSDSAYGESTKSSSIGSTAVAASGAAPSCGPRPANGKSSGRASHTSSVTSFNDEDSSGYARIEDLEMMRSSTNTRSDGPPKVIVQPVTEVVQEQEVIAVSHRVPVESFPERLNRRMPEIKSRKNLSLAVYQTNYLPGLTNGQPTVLSSSQIDLEDAGSAQIETTTAASIQSNGNYSSPTVPEQTLLLQGDDATKKMSVGSCEGGLGSGIHLVESPPSPCYSARSDSSAGVGHSPTRKTLRHRMRRSNSSTSSLSSSELFPEVVRHHHVKFDKDTLNFWYKPKITRDEAITLLKDKPPGTFVVRDSQSYKGAFGLAVKVATPPLGVIQQAGGDITKINMENELIRHFLIEPCKQGVRLKGSNNEPAFPSLVALIFQHSVTKMALPIELMLPSEDIENFDDVDGKTILTEQQVLQNGAACNLVYLASIDVEGLSGDGAVKYAINKVLSTNYSVKSAVVKIKVDQDGITLTDIDRRLFFRKHYVVKDVLHCIMDPRGRRYNLESIVADASHQAPCFGVVVCKPQKPLEHECIVFAEIEPLQPASAVINFIHRVIKNGKK